MDYKLALKPSALLNFLQDLASEHAQMLGFGYSYVKPRNMAWFLLKYHMEFEDYPAGIYDLKIVTEPRGYQRTFASRDFTLYGDKKLLGRVASTWAIMNFETGSLVPIQSLDNPAMPPLEKREADLTYAKIPPVTNPSISKTFEVRYDDIDVNGHVNNANYIVWAFETLERDFRASHKLKTLDMAFKKEVKYGESVFSEVEFADNASIHVIKNAVTGEELCCIRAEYAAIC
jgi:medium-chain acyl-[acyl-carrier-protein] hydrolase